MNTNSKKMLKRSGKILLRVFCAVVYLLLTGILLVVLVLSPYVFDQTKKALDSQRNIDNIRNTMASLSADIRQLTDQHTRELEQRARNIAYLTKTRDPQKALEQGAEICRAEYLFLADRNGRIAASVDGSMVGKSAQSELARIASMENPPLQAKAETEDGSVLYLFEPADILQTQIGLLSEPANFLGDRSKDGDFFTFFVKPEGDDAVLSFYRHKGEDYSGDSISSHGITMDILKSGYVGRQSIDGIYYYCRSEYIGSNVWGGGYLVSASIQLNLLNSTSRIVFWSIAILILAMVILISYTHFLNGKCPSRFSFLLRMLPISLVLFVFTWGLVFYIKTLEDISDAISLADYSIETYEEREIANRADSDRLAEVYEEENLISAKLMSLCVEDNMDLLAQGESRFYRVSGTNGLRRNVRDASGNDIVAFARCPLLQSLADSQDYQNVYYINADGYAVASSGEDWHHILTEDDPSGISLLDVLDQKIPFIHEEQEGCSVIAVKCGNGLLVAQRYSLALDYNANARSELILKAAEASLNTEISFSPIGEESKVVENLFLRENGTTSFVHTVPCEKLGLYAAVSYVSSDFFQSRNSYLEIYGKLAAIAVAVVLFLRFLLFRTGSNRTEDNLLSTLNSRYDFKPWHMMTPGEKAGAVITFCLLAIVCLIGFEIISAKINPDHSSAIHYILSGNWSRGMDFFSFSACGFALFAAFSLHMVFRVLMRLVCSGMEEYRRAKFHFVSVLFSILVFITAVLACLYMLGVDIKGLFASAGIAAGIIAYANSALIASFVQGVANLYLDHFRVGEWISYDDFHGQIKAMTLLRVTIVNKGGDIKLVNNNELSGAINLSRNPSRVYINIPIDVDNDLVSIEKLIMDNLDSVKAKYGEKLFSLSYYSISELQEGAITITLKARCHESVKNYIKYGIMRDIIVLLMNSGVKFPHHKYDEYVLSNLSDKK